MLHNWTASEQDIEDYTRYYYSAMGNGIVELRIKGATEPVNCEVITPVNLIIKEPVEVIVKHTVEKFRRNKKNALKRLVLT